jgi:exopolysaccharide production protein ExoQ
MTGRVSGRVPADKMPSARRAIKFIVYAITLLSLGIFGARYYGGDPTAEMPAGARIQQGAILALWLLLIGCSFLNGALAKPLRTRGLLWPALFACYVVISPVWSEAPGLMGAKAVVFSISAIGVWRLTSILSVTEMITITTRSLLVLMIASAAAIILVPKLSISHDWRPEALDYQDVWVGIFAQKQVLGISAAYFTFIMLFRTWQRRKFSYFLGFILGASLTMGSGSRGGAIMATVASTAILAARNYPRLYPMIISSILVMLAAAGMIIAYLALTGNDSILVAGRVFDFDNRTEIWQYAVSLWQSHALLGFGVDGFWTNPNTSWEFLRRHGWVLENYHNGFLAILVETGLIGAGLFCVITWRLCSRFRFLLRLGPTDALELSLGLILMTYVLNLTETGFLRSTDFYQILFNFLAVNVLATSRSSRRAPTRFVVSPINPGPRRLGSPESFGPLPD